MKKDEKLLGAGYSGAAIAAICGFTPALVVVLGVAGLSTIVGWLDYGLDPISFAAMGLVTYALYLRSGRNGPSPAAAIAVAAYAYYLRACVRRQDSQLADTKETIS
jgi:hypothetical protein